MSRRRPTGSGDRDRVAVFDGLYEATFAQVLAFCRRRTRSLEDAEDAVAETYLVAWRRLDEAVSAERPLLWLYSVAVKVAANQRRGRDRFGRLVGRLAGLGGRRSVPGADDPLLTTVGAADVAAALERLSRTDREIVRLVAYEQLTHAEAGRVMGLSETAVRSRLFRARRRLRRSLDEIRRDDPPLPDTHLDERPPTPSGEDRGEQP